MMLQRLTVCVLLLSFGLLNVEASGKPGGSQIVPTAPAAPYPDGRPTASYRLNATDQGVVMRHGDGPNGCDQLGAREALVFQHKGTYYLHYDGAGPTGWLACLATSTDLTHWVKHGPVLDLGKPGEPDSATASSPWVYFDGKLWHMFYVSTPNATPPPDRIPAVPYQTMTASSKSPAGPWVKTHKVVLHVQPGTYYSDTSSAGQVVAYKGGFLMFFSAAQASSRGFERTIGLARAHDLNGPWTPDPEPIVPLTEQIENTSVYYEASNKTWFLFTNHIGLASEGEYGDSHWVYWTRDIEKWNPKHKAVVMDGANCTWSHRCLGVPSVVRVGNRLAIIYDAPGGASVSNMSRDVGLGWLNLPLIPPASE